MFSLIDESVLAAKAMATASNSIAMQKKLTSLLFSTAPEPWPEKSSVGAFTFVQGG